METPRTRTYIIKKKISDDSLKPKETTEEKSKDKLNESRETEPND